VPAKNTKMVSSKKSAVLKKGKISSLTKVGSAKTKKGATRSLSLSKIKEKSAAKKQAVKVGVAKVTAKAEPARSAAVAQRSKATSKVVSRPAAKQATTVKTAEKPKASAPVAVASANRSVAISQAVVEPIKRKEPEKRPASNPHSNTLGALKVFEAAMKAFTRHNFPDAKEAFEQLLARYSAETELVARVRTYLAICIQRLAPPKALPRNIDALYN